MRKVVLYMASSIDGFIASSDGSVDWIDTKTDIGEKYSFETFLQRVDTILMGRKSYEQTVGFGEWAFSHHHTLVFSQTLKESNTPQTTIEPKLSAPYIRSLTQQEGKDLWLFGGGLLNHFFLENDLIDEMMLFVQPTVLGNGIGIFGNKATQFKTFNRKQSVELAGGFTLLHYQKT